MKSKISDQFTIAVTSDLHLGNKRNTTSEIIKNLNIAFTDDAAFAQLDMLVLAGDIFDSSLSSVDILPIAVWQTRLIRLCKKHNVALRILKGTPSHDWEQSVSFDYVNSKISGLNADVKYIKDLSIVYEEKFDLNFLYVPDEWSDSSEKTLEEVRTLLAAKGLKQVDFAISHGNYDFQLPEFVKAPKHDSEAYLKLVKYLLFIGHIHIRSHYERIYAQGSFDRLAHNEEDPKGYLRAKVKVSGEYEIEFIENKGAKKFITIDCSHLSIEEALKKIEEVVASVPEESHLRVKAFREDLILSYFETLIKDYPAIHWSKLAIKVEEKKEGVKTEELFKPIEITKDNLEKLLMPELLAQTTDSEVLTCARHAISDFIGQAR